MVGKVSAKIVAHSIIRSSNTEAGFISREQLTPAILHERLGNGNNMKGVSTKPRAHVMDLGHVTTEVTPPLLHFLLFYKQLCGLV